MRDHTGEILTNSGKDSVARINSAKREDIFDNHGNYLRLESPEAGLV